MIRTTSKECKAAAGCCSTMWTSSFISFIRRHGPSTSSSASGATRRSSSAAMTTAERRGWGLALALGALLCATPATAQNTAYFGGYFGQNKVQYSKFHFQIVQTDHFDIYF